MLKIVSFEIIYLTGYEIHLFKGLSKNVHPLARLEFF